jgi:peptidoglycan/xylan/chitin deacetylase (PgdA/CDA1 family)
MDMRQTFFVPGWCIEKDPEAVDLLVEGGREIAHHGYLHERPNEVSAEDEHYWIIRGIAAYEKHLGHRPCGWRAPSFAFSKHSLGYLIQARFEYDFSVVGDDIPYLLRHQAGAMIELPAGWTIDDWPQYAHNRDFKFTMPFASPARAMEVFRAEFDTAWSHGGLWVSVWHPFVSARPARFDAVLGLINYRKAKGGVWFARLDEIHNHVKAVLAEGQWVPRVQEMPTYDSPIPELSRD